MKKIFLHPYSIFFIKLFIAATIITALLSYIDLKNIVSSFKTANQIYILIGSALGIVSIAFQFYRWKYLLQLISKDIPNKEILSSIVIGIAAGMFTPGQIGEFAGRIAAHTTIQKLQIAGMSLVDKLYITAATIIFGFLGITIFFSTYYSSQWNWIFSLLAFCIVLLTISISLFPSVIKKILFALPSKIRKHKVYSMIEIIESTFFAQHARVMLITTLAFYLMLFFQYYIFASAFEPVSFWNTSIAVSSIFFVKNLLLPFSIGDLGVRESAAIFFFTKYGVAVTTAFNTSMFIFITNVFLPSIIGAMFIIRLKFTTSK